VLPITRLRLPRFIHQQLIDAEDDSAASSMA
jgi:hypothetical protein